MFNQHPIERAKEEESSRDTAVVDTEERKRKIQHSVMVQECNSIYDVESRARYPEMQLGVSAWKPGDLCPISLELAGRSGWQTYGGYRHGILSRVEVSGKHV